MIFPFDEIKKLIYIFQEKDIFDYMGLLINAATPISIFWLGYYTFNKTPQQLAKSKIKEKEVEMLYKAFDSFFNFSDAIGLFISNKERKFKKNIHGYPLEASFEKKETDSSEAVYLSFRDYNLASHILRAIGDKETEDKIDIFKTKAVELRKLIIDFELSAKASDVNEIDIICRDISIKRSELDKIKDECFDQISKHKEKLKNDR